MLMCFTPHAANWAFQGFLSVKRCFDRGCKPLSQANDKYTKKLTQQEYEDVNCGNEFLLEFRYANILTVLAIAFFYSSGMPFLYLVAAIYFFLAYWIDKIMLFRFYCKPVNFDQYIAEKTLNWFKYILLLHMVNALFMYGNTPILFQNQSQFSNLKQTTTTTSRRYLQGEERENGEDLLTESSDNGSGSSSSFTAYELYMVIMALILIGSLFYICCLKQCIACVKFLCCAGDREEEEKSLESNFYDCIHYAQLKFEHEYVDSQL